MTQQNGREHADRWARSVVWGTWLAGFVGALWLIARFGFNVPFWDDWRYVPVLAGERPLSLGWLWTEANSHRFPMAKLLLWVGSRLSGGDVRAGMLLSALVLAGTAALMIRQAAALRGRTHLSDALFPLLLLHWGHFHTLLWSINLLFACACAVLCWLVTLMARGIGDDAPPGRMRALVACALLLPVQMAGGLAATPAVALGLLVVAALARTPGRKRMLRWTALGMLTLVVLYLVQLDDHGPVPAPPGVGERLRTALQFVSTSLGPAGRTLWPFSGLTLAGALAAAVGLLLAGWRRDPARRVHLAGLLAVIAGLIAVALAIAQARAGFGWTAGFAPRYVTLSCPLLAWAYFACLTSGSARARRFGPPALCLALACLLPLNTTAGLTWAREHAQLMTAFQDDVRADLPPEEIIQRHGPKLSSRQGHLLNAMQQMQRTGQGVYRQ